MELDERGLKAPILRTYLFRYRNIIITMLIFATRNTDETQAKTRTIEAQSPFQVFYTIAPRESAKAKKSA